MLRSPFGVVEPTDREMFVVTGWASLTDQQKNAPMQTRQVAALTDMAAASVARAAEPRFVVTGVASLAQLKEQVDLLEKARRGQVKCLADQALFKARGTPLAAAPAVNAQASQANQEGLAAE